MFPDEPGNDEADTCPGPKASDLPDDSASTIASNQIKLKVITSIASKATKEKQTVIEEKRFKFFWDKKRF